MKILVYISSLTGNTKKVGLHVAEKLRSLGHDVTIENTHETASVIRNLSAAERKSYALPSADLVLVCFWCRRSGMDYESLLIPEFYTGQRIAALGTMGGEVNGSYGERVRTNVKTLLTIQNQCEGVFLCQGKIREARTEARRNLPPDDPKYLDDAGYARHLATRSHPDEKDLEAAWAAVREWIS